MTDDAERPVPAAAEPRSSGARDADPVRSMVRAPTSLLRLLFGVVVLAFGVLTAWRFTNTMAAMNIDWEKVSHLLPAWIRAIPLVIVGLTFVLVPVVVNVQLIRYRRGRLLVIVNLAAISAFVLSEVLVSVLTRRPPSLFPQAYGSGGGESLNDPLFAAFVAAFIVGVPYLARPTRRLAVGVIVLSLLAALGFADVPAIAWLIDLGTGITCGAALALLFGTPDSAPDRGDLVDALGRSGIDITDIAPAAVDARGSTPWLGTTVDGRSVFVKVLNQDNRSADLMFRAFRALFLRNTGDERPMSSLRRSVEHEALLSLRATAAGIPTPELLTVSEIGNDAMLLAFEAIDGDSLDRVADDDLTDDVLDAVWTRVAQLQRNGIAHRDLRLANIFTGSDGELYLIDFGFAELAASSLLLDTDLAELIASTTPAVGVVRAVEAAERAFGVAGLRRALPRLQPSTLGGATRAALKESGQLEALRSEVESRAQVPEPTYAGVVPTAAAVPIAVFTILTIAAVVGAVVISGGPEVVAGITAWKHAVWLLVAAAIGLASAVISIQGSLRDPLDPRSVLGARLAMTYGDALRPLHSAAVAIRVAFLRSRGVDTTAALGSTGVALASRVVTVLAVAYLAVRISGRDGAIGVEVTPDPLWVAVTILIVVAGLASNATPPLRRIVARDVAPALGEAGSGLKSLTGHPSRIARLVLGALFVSFAAIGVLVAADRAAGGTLDPPSIALTVLVVTLVCGLLPVPGGAGIAEAGMIAGLVLLGERPGVAITAVVLARLVTMWLPMAAGARVLRKISRTRVV